MKKIIYITCVVILGFLSSCDKDKWLDINKNPNSATTVQADYLYSGAITAFSANRIGGDGFCAIGTGCQMWSSGGLWGNYGDFYVFSPYSTGNCFSIVYGTAGKNLFLAVEEAKKMDPVQNNTIAQCMIFSAQTFFQNTLTYGDIPMRESFDMTIVKPKYDSQEQVLDSIVLSLDAAIAMIDDSPTAISGNDLVYGGDMDQWTKYAKSLKFKTLMFMVDRKPEYASKITAMLSAGGMIDSEADNFTFPYFDVAGNRHAMFTIGDQYYGPDGIDDFFMTPADGDIMNPTNDPRRAVFFTPGEDAAGDYIACGASEDATDASAFYNAAKLAKPDQEDVMLAYSEQLLLEAEAEVRFNNDLVAGKSKFDAGLRASLAYWDIDETAQNSFIAQYSFTDATQALKLIHEQQWVDLLPRPIEGWSNWRRSGPKDQEVPALSVPINANAPDLFRGWPYPVKERSANLDNMPDPLPEIYDHMWFDL